MYARVGGALADYYRHFPGDCDKADRLVRQLHLAVLQFAHLQHVVYKRQQVIGRHHHLFVIRPEQFAVIKVSLIYIEQSYYAVERRAYIVTHAAQEAALGGISALSLNRRLMQLPVLLLQLCGILALCLDLLALIRLRGAPAHRAQQYDKYHIQKQRISYALRRCRKHAALVHKCVYVVVPALVHQSEFISEQALRIPFAHKVRASAFAHNALDYRHSVYVHIDKLRGVGCDYTVVISYDYRAVLLGREAVHQRAYGVIEHA